uniref:Chitin-binding type-4 domain-containing protein n=1 Tax=Heterorhabditis bacteriophora TaxID=37862 RepID=A0A1I7XD56_HETBA
MVFMKIVGRFAKAESIPKHWGGRLVDSNGDGMCRERLNIPTDPIPQELYWIPTVETPSLNDITCATIPAGKNKIITFVVPEHHPTYMVINRYCDRTFGMGIWYSEDPEAVDYPLEEMSDWCPDFDYPGMPTVDYLCIKVPGPGVFKLKFGNEQVGLCGH